MGQIKARTQLELLGFKDADRKNSKHDIIQSWVNENIKQVISETIMKKNPHPFKINRTKWEHQVFKGTGDYKSIVGYIDLMVSVSGMFYNSALKDYESENIQVFIEVKTDIPVLGDLIRQMRAYQSFEPPNFREYLIVSPDDRFIKTLNEQGFYFYKYNDPTSLF